ncbi:MAG: pitrilysin family protein [Desulfovibrionales bacterium]|nr:pitrilysin family protein [Desulfovibrionales bacterium]
MNTNYKIIEGILPMKPYHKRIITSLLSLILLSFIFITIPGIQAEEAFPNPYRFQLDNGLTVIIKENHAAPVAAIQVWVKAGSVYETDNEAGITHFIEHMIFKGTAKREPGEIARAIEAVGGDINAYTSLDYTVYHVAIGSKFFDVGLDILSDAVLHSSFDQLEIEREKMVVLEEIRMRQDQPSVKLFEAVMAKAYTVSPYRRPVIGFPKTVQPLTRDSILAYMKKRYTPSNLTVVVVGDLETADCISRIKRAFSGMKGAAPESVSLEEPPQNEVRTVLLEDEINESHLNMCFPIPGFNDPDSVALDVLASILGEGESSRLYRELRDQKTLVHDIGAYAFTPMGPGLFEVACSLDAEKSKQAAEAALREIYRLRYDHVTEDELNKAKLNIESGFIYAQERVQGQARKLGYFETMAGDYREQASYLKKVAAVTPEDIRRVAAKYLHPERLTLGLLVPKEATMPFSMEEAAHLSRAADEEAKKLYASRKVEISGAQKFILSNGITLLVKEERNVPTVSMHAVFLGGLRYETAADNGLFNALAQLWTKGTKRRGAQEIAAEIEGMAGSINGFSGKNTFGLSATFLSRFFSRGLDILTEVMLEPDFSPKELEKVRPVLLAQLKQQEDSLPAITFLNFNKLLFTGYPYSMNPLGSPETIKKLSTKKIKEGYQRYVIPGNLVLAIVGDVEASSVKSEVERLLSRWKNPGFRDVRIALPRPVASPKTASILKSKQQVHIAIGFRGVTLSHPDRAALDVLNNVLSGQGGRLFARLRDKESLAYSLSAFSTEGIETGAFGVYIATSPEKKDAAVNSMWRELNRVRDEIIDPAELDRAKRYIIGSTEIGLQTNAAQAMDMALNERYRLGFDFTKTYLDQIEKVTVDNVLRVARTYIQPEKYVVVAVGPNSAEQRH